MQGMSRFAPWLAEGLLITDGAWGTELQARGLQLGDSADAWNLSQPRLVEEVACAYAEAGSQVILTNTFRANAVAMPDRSVAELDEINRAGVAISKRAAAHARVVASIGPTGKTLHSGEVSREQVLAALDAQAQSLAAAGADALLIETFSELEEAMLAVGAARNTGLPVIASFAFVSGRNKDRTMTGATPEAVAVAMVDAGADAVGTNCGAGVALAVPVCRRLHAACDLPIWVKPNAGLPVLEAGNIRYGTSAGFFASHVAALRDAGASFLGGCCGSTPEFIRALVKARSGA